VLVSDDCCTYIQVYDVQDQCPDEPYHISRLLSVKD
jgi:hypothetical protein